MLKKNENKSNESKQNVKPKKSSNSFGKLLSMSFRNYCHVILGTLFLIINALSSSILPVVVGSLFDNLSGYTPDKGSAVWEEIMAFKLTYNEKVMLLVAMALSTFVFGFCRAVCFEIVAEGLVYDIRDELYAKTVHKPIEFFDENTSGDLNSRLSADCTKVRDALTTNFSFILRSLIMFFVSVAAMLLISWKMSLALLIPIPIFVTIMWPISTYLRSISKERQDKIAAANSWSEECFSNIRTLKSFGNEWYSHLVYRTRLKEILRYGILNAFVTSAMVSFFLTFPYALIVVILYYGNILHGDGEITAGELSAFVLLSVQTGFSLSSLGPGVSQVFQALGATDRIFAIIDEKEKIEPSVPEKVIKDDPMYKKLFPTNLQNNKNVVIMNQGSNPYVPYDNNKINFIDKASIRFDNVSFRYPTRPDDEVFSNLSFTIKEGDSVAIVGQSGAGKSTISALLQRLYDVSQGSVRIGDVDVKDYDPYSLHKQIGYVQQEPVLFSGSIRENVMFSKEVKGTVLQSLITKYSLTDYSDKAAVSEVDVKKLLDLSHSSEFVDKLKDKDETLVGERGVKLSGGQRQRIAISRALANNPKILIFDEATSSLDGESEKWVNEAIVSLLTEGRITTMVIAHRLSTIKSAKYVMMLKEGRIVEYDTHENLMKKDSEYRKLIEKQIQTKEIYE